MRVVYKEPKKPAVIREVKNELEDLQDLVGGYIELVNYGPKTVLICNEEGKLRNLEVNFELRDGDHAWDVIVGPAFFCGAKGEDFCSLSLAEAESIIEKLNKSAINI